MQYLYPILIKFNVVSQNLMEFYFCVHEFCKTIFFPKYFTKYRVRQKHVTVFEIK
jgi:hypothetical protein